MGLLSSLFRMFGKRRVQQPAPFVELHFVGDPDPVPDPSDPLDYDKLIHLDAEELAEQGMAEAYADMRGELEKIVGPVEEFEELDDSDLPSYSVRFRGEIHVVYSPDVPGSDRDSWRRASIIFFHLINAQLSESKVRFYALHGGNDLSGMFLTPEVAAEARAHHKRESDKPYLIDLAMLNQPPDC